MCICYVVITRSSNGVLCFLLIELDFTPNVLPIVVLFESMRLPLSLRLVVRGKEGYVRLPLSLRLVVRGKEGYVRLPLSLRLVVRGKEGYVRLQ